MVHGRNDAQIFQDLSHSRLSNGHILIHFGLSFRPGTSRRPTRPFPAQQQMYLFTAHEYLRWKPRRTKRAFGLYYKYGLYKYMDFTARLIPQFVRYIKEQLKKSDPDEALHWNEVTREDPTMMEDLRILEHVGLPQTDEQRAHQLRIQLQHREQQPQPGASGQHVFSMAESSVDTNPGVGAYSLRANAFSEYRAKSLEENKEPDGQHPLSQGVQDQTTGSDDGNKHGEEMENQEDDGDDGNEDEDDEDDEEKAGLGRSEKNPVPDQHARQHAQWKEKFDAFHEEQISKYRIKWFEYVLGLPE